MSSVRDLIAPRWFATVVAILVVAGGAALWCTRVPPAPDMGEALAALREVYPLDAAEVDSVVQNSDGLSGVECAFWVAATNWDREDPERIIESNGWELRLSSTVTMLDSKADLEWGEGRSHSASTDYWARDGLHIWRVFPREAHPDDGGAIFGASKITGVMPLRGIARRTWFRYSLLVSARPRGRWARRPAN